MSKVSREEVFNVINGEREYQNSVWNPTTTTSDGMHSFEEWYTYIQDYVREAQHILSRKPKQEADLLAAHIMRKVAAMAVCSMEQNGAPPRVVQPKVNG